MTTPPSGQFLQDLISEIFGGNTDLAYLGQVSKQGEGRGEGFNRYFRSQTGDFVRRFQTAVGRQLTEGKLPTVRSEGFFAGLNLPDEFLKFSPEDRGMSTQAFNPRTTFHF